MTASPTDAAQLPPEDVSQSEVIREVARPDAVEKVCGTILPPPIFRRDPCRYFMAGECWYGASCHYSHDVEQPKQKLAVRTAWRIASSQRIMMLTPMQADGRPLCSFHLKGVCMRGSACRFSHDEVASSCADSRPHCVFPRRTPFWESTALPALVLPLIVWSVSPVAFVSKILVFAEGQLNERAPSMPLRLRGTK